MSEWYEAEDEDVELDRDCQEVNILVTHNDFGNVYVTLTFDQIREIYNKMENPND